MQDVHRVADLSEIDDQAGGQCPERKPAAGRKSDQQPHIQGAQRTVQVEVGRHGCKARSNQHSRSRRGTYKR